MINAPPGQGDRVFTPNFLLLWATNLTTFTGFELLLPTLPLYVLALGGTESQVGLINGIFSISAVIFYPFLGREADRRGKKLVLACGTAALLVSMASYNLASTVGLLFPLRLFHGVAWAAAIAAGMGLVADISPASRRGEALGYYGTAADLSMALGPLLGVALLTAYGFNHLFLAGTGLALVALLMSTRIREPSRPQAEGPPKGNATLVHRASLFPASIVLVATMSYGGLLSFLPLLAQRKGINTGVFFAIYAIFLMATRPVGGRVADAFGRAAAVIPGMALTALAMGMLAFASSLAHFALVAALYGIGFAFLHPALLALAVDRASPEARGSAMGTFNGAFELGIGLGSILLGILLERTNFQMMYLTAAGITLAGMAAFALRARKGLRDPCMTTS